VSSAPNCSCAVDIAMNGTVVMNNVLGRTFSGEAVLCFEAPYPEGDCSPPGTTIRSVNNGPIYGTLLKPIIIANLECHSAKQVHIMKFNGFVLYLWAWQLSRYSGYTGEVPTGESDFDSSRGQTFLSTASKPAVGHIQPPIQWVRG
jgi:hypothetical protein